MKKYLISLLLIFSFPINLYAYSSSVIVGGNNIGIEVKTKGILVNGYYKLNGKYINKNKIKIGDYIIKVNGEDVGNIDDFKYLIDKYITNDEVNITILRKDEYIDISLDVMENNGKFKTGLYVKDSLTGIGTITYVDPETKIYGALGHEITERNSNDIIKIDEGSIYDSEVTSINRSYNGNPGSKNADIEYDDKLGSINTNTSSGIFGYYEDNLNNELLDVADFNEIHTGTAYIYTVTKHKKINKYKIKIIKVEKRLIDTPKSIAFIIDDDNLIKETGGIVQGMSGSPIIQDGKIIGAVTNVIVDKVNKGYGIFIKTMLSVGDQIK